MACRVKTPDRPGITSGKNCQALSPLDRLEEFDALRMGVVNRSVGIGREPFKLEGDGRAALRWRDSELGRGLTCGLRRPSPSRITPAAPSLAFGSGPAIRATPGAAVSLRPEVMPLATASPAVVSRAPRAWHGPGRVAEACHGTRVRGSAAPCDFEGRGLALVRASRYNPAARAWSTRNRSLRRSCTSEPQRRRLQAERDSLV